MIDKIKIGNYLKKLRLEKKRDKDGKSFSQDDLSREFYKRNVSISLNAIAEWERGVVLPSLDNLEVLAEIYNKTLDEILDGEDRINKDFSRIYFISNHDWGMQFDKNANLYQIRNEQIKLIVKRFKELLLIRINRAFTAGEETEFRFLFMHFYSVTDYIYEYTELEINDDYVKLKDALNGSLFKNKNMSKKEQYWEIQKFFSENKELWFNHWNDAHDLRNVRILQDRFDYIEDWQKDMLLAMFQNIEPFSPDKCGSIYLKKYEEQNGEYNHEQSVKDDIKELIKRGACLNKYFLNIKKGYFETRRIIDRLEELYNMCLKPIEIHMINKDDDTESYLIENNLKNRFLNKYYFSLKYELKEYCNKDDSYSDIDKVYEWFINHDEIPEEFYFNLAKKNNIDTTQDKKYWLEDAKNYSILEKYLKEFKETERKIAEGLIEIDVLKTKLQKGEKEYKIRKYKIIGGNDESSIRKYIEYLKQKIDYSEYLKNRDKMLTQNLFIDLDILSLEEIKAKYFKMEVIDDE